MFECFLAFFSPTERNTLLCQPRYVPRIISKILNEPPVVVTESYTPSCFIGVRRYRIIPDSLILLVIRQYAPIGTFMSEISDLIREEAAFFGM